MKLWPFQDRRSFPRWRVSINVMYGTDVELTATTSLDISEHAISIYARTPYPAGQVLQLHIASNADQELITVKAKVVRSASGIMVLEFLNLQKKDLAQLGCYLRDLHQAGRSELIGV